VSWHIRGMRAEDDAAVAAIIRAVMPEFGADGLGFAIHDPEVDCMSAHYARSQAAYFVVEDATGIAGGGGIAQLEGADPDTCELKKMYFLPRLRGLGAGSALIQTCLAAARERGYRRCYLETLTGMDAAQALYLKADFARIPAALGSTGHFGCNRFYLRSL